MGLIILITGVITLLIIGETPFRGIISIGLYKPNYNK